MANENGKVTVRQKHAAQDAILELIDAHTQALIETKGVKSNALKQQRDRVAKFFGE